MVSALPGVSSRVGRRATVALGLAAVGATGCGLGSRTTSAPTAAPTSGAPASADTADLELLDQARDAVTVMLASVRAARVRHPSLRSPLQPLATLHRRHLDVLDGAGRATAQTSPVEPAEVRPRARRALIDVRDAELSLERTLGEQAVAAASGDFARLLASMAAAVAQAVTVLPEGP